MLCFLACCVKFLGFFQVSLFLVMQIVTQECLILHTFLDRSYLVSWQAIYWLVSKYLDGCVGR